MEELFLKCLNLSIRTSYMILAVLAIRLLFKEGMAKYRVWLWIAVFARLVFPFSLQSIFSFLPQGDVVTPEIMTTETPAINTGFDAVDQTVNPFLMENYAPEPYNSANPMQILTYICAVVWIAGIVIMLLYVLVSAVLLKRRTMKYGVVKGDVLESPSVDSPFVYGVFHPVICLPKGLDEAERRYVLLHEWMHIRRKDHIIKAVSFLLLAIYWYNPLVWLAYRLLSYDIELACDEAVIREMDRQEQSDYAETLLRCAASNKNLLSPVAFGETNVKKRIKNILKYRRPAFWIMTVLLGLCIILCAGFFTDPIHADSTDSKDPTVTPSPNETYTVTLYDENERITYTGEDPRLDAEFRRVFKTLMEVNGTEEGILFTEAIDNINDISITDGERYLGFMDGSMHGLTDDPTFVDSSYYVELHEGKNEKYLLVRNDSKQMTEILSLVNFIKNKENPSNATDHPQEADQKELETNQYADQEETVLTVESLLQNPSAYVNTYIHVLGNLPQGTAGTDENGNWMLYLSGVNDLNQHIRIINYTPSDGSCLVEAYGTLVYLDSGELALSMDGYTLQQEETALTVEAVLQNPSAYVNTIVYIQGHLPQSTAGMDENGNWILYLCGVNDLNQHIRIVHYTPTDGSCLVEAFGTLIYLDNGELALSMRGYTVLQ